MEKSRVIRYSSRSLLGLIVLSVTFIANLSAKEIFDAPVSYPATGFDYGCVKTVSFFFPGNKDMDVDAIVKSISKDKADVVITGKASLMGEAMSPSLSTYVFVQRNVKEKSWLVTINSCVNGVSTKAIDKDGNPYRSSISISDQVLVFVDSSQKEVEAAITCNLQNLVDKITASNQSKLKFFVIH